MQAQWLRIYVLLHLKRECVIRIKQKKAKTKMCRTLETYGEEQRLEGRLEGILEARHECKIEIAKRMIARGKLSLEEIAEATELSLEQVKEIALSIHS